MKYLKSFLLISLVLLSFHCYASTNKWTLSLKQPSQKPLAVNTFSFEGKKVAFTKKVGEFNVSFTAENKGDYWYYVAEAKSLMGEKS
jgi:hypothetical protein